ncbi:MAG TPA: asparagine synthase (glutamine-hydrolyzing) [Terrimicrobiaceae bacterium]|nr:asparagine synthase (glutamine-hydrolyzing) [Terrimicrobiaceae bacterium]
MCGIFGFSGFVEKGLLARMGDILAHRGPDGEGSYEDEPHRFSMGMRRLSIIDLDGGWQPIYNEDRSLVVCFNGEIYNYIELHDQLVEEGHTFRTRSDTEVIVHAYEKWGRECVKHFNGMFAFALHDSRTGDTFFSRDRCGQKPLYYHQSNGRFVFASEVKAILECSRVPRACNVAAIDAYLALRYVPEPRTMFEGIFTLPAAHSLLLRKDGSLMIERYWDVPIFQGKYRPESELLDETEAMLRNAVRLTMRSDVPVGGYLSAGVDSSLLVALMTESSDKVNTYSIGFNSPVDETHDAAETARLLGTSHHEIQCAPQDFDLLPKIVWHMDRPVGDALIIAFYKLAEGAARDLKVIISGEGADEVFAGYSFQNVIQLAECYHQLLPGFLHRKLAMPMLRALPVDFLNKFFIFPAKLGHQGKARLVDFMGSYGCRNLFENYIALKTLWPRTARAAAYTSQFKQLATDKWIPPLRDNSGQFLDRLLKIQWDEWLQDWCIIRQDKNTMAHSLEIRLPFLDHNLIELAFRVPPRLKNNGFRDKIIERKIASKLLPRPVTHRKKNPFFLPMEFFFEHPQIRRLIAETLNETQVRKRGYFEPDYVKNLLRQMETREFIYLKQVMALVILELWHKIFIDNEKGW